MKKVPFENPYEVIKLLGKLSIWLIILSALLTIGIYFDFFGNSEVTPLVKPFNLTVLCIYTGLKIFSNYYYLHIERYRRIDFVDNSLGTNLSAENSEGYFTNEKLKPGILKMAVNSFENSTHTHNTLRIMVRRKLVWMLTFSIIFFGSAFSGHGDIVRLLFEIALPVIFIQEFITTCIYLDRIGRVKRHFFTLFNNLKTGSSFENQIPHILTIILDYESAVSWSSLPLSGKIFMKHNNRMSEQWNETKNKLKIE